MSFNDLREDFYSRRMEPSFKEEFEDFFSNEKPDVVTTLSFPEYHEVFDRREELILEGTLVLGALVMANNTLYNKRKKDDCPADFIYSFDPYFEEHQEELIQLAEALYSYSELPEEELWFDMYKKEISDMLNAEITPEFNYKVPEVLTNGKEVYLTTLIVKRADISNKYLEHSLYPLLVKEGIKGSIILSHYIYNPEAKVIEKFKKRKRNQFIIPVLAVIALVYAGFERNSIYWIVVFGILVLFTFINWRCPNCHAYLGKGSNPTFCPKCSIRLKE